MVDTKFAADMLAVSRKYRDGSHTDEEIFDAVKSVYVLNRIEPSEKAVREDIASIKSGREIHYR